MKTNTSETDHRNVSKINSSITVLKFTIGRRFQCVFHSWFCIQILPLSEEDLYHHRLTDKCNITCYTLYGCHER